ncbi:hypothetical protein [Streptomyces phytophilus]|uniref:hypothetical protein n=1 Tax=Streptomyces phytophilus TaxID=722715 RepID=UPI00215DB545|nr:hypothetical protein [Streptomyces phytophilus]
MTSSALCCLGFEPNYCLATTLVALLTSRLAAAFVRGVQDGGVGATPKHFVANDAETDRLTVDIRIGERALREL